jgi:hypothetical protein
MLLDFPVWPVVEFERLPELMSISEIEEFAPAIPCELLHEEIEELTLADALAIPGGLAVFCHRRRLQNEENGLTAISANRRKKK